VRGNPPASLRRTIKAATFHDLMISTVSDGLEVTIVFDV
jgi:SHS2 domain-containing protein